MIKRLVITIVLKNRFLTERLVKDNIISIRNANIFQYFLLILVSQKIIS